LDSYFVCSLFSQDREWFDSTSLQIYYTKLFILNIKLVKQHEKNNK